MGNSEDYPISYRRWKFFGWGPPCSTARARNFSSTDASTSCLGYSQAGNYSRKRRLRISDNISLTRETMTATPDSKRRDTRPKKRKRDPAEVERQAKHGQKRVRKQKGEANGLLSSPKSSVVPDNTAEDVKAGTSALQPVARSQEPASKGPIARRRLDDTQEAGWTVSRPLGGRISDIDPILTPDER